MVIVIVMGRGEGGDDWIRMGRCLFIHVFNYLFIYVFNCLV